MGFHHEWLCYSWFVCLFVCLFTCPFIRFFLIFHPRSGYLTGIYWLLPTRVYTTHKAYYSKGNLFGVSKACVYTTHKARFTAPKEISVESVILLLHCTQGLLLQRKSPSPKPCVYTTQKARLAAGKEISVESVILRLHYTQGLLFQRKSPWRQ